MPAALAGLLMAASCGPVSAAAERYEGSAHARDDGRLLHREIHWRLAGPGQPSRVVLYTCPDGTPFARKRVWGGAGATAPRFEFVDGRDGYREGVRENGDGLEVFWRARTGAAERRSPVGAGPGKVFDAGFDELVRSAWEPLEAGESVQADFLLPSRLGFLAVQVRRADPQPKPADVLHLRMTLDAWYGFVAPRTDLTYRREDRWLLRFEGIGTIRDAKGRHQDVRIEFPADRRRTGVPREEVDAALAKPLARGCGNA